MAGHPFWFTYSRFLFLGFSPLFVIWKGGVDFYECYVIGHDQWTSYRLLMAYGVLLYAMYVPWYNTINGISSYFCVICLCMFYLSPVLFSLSYISSCCKWNRYIWTEYTCRSVTFWCSTHANKHQAHNGNKGIDVSLHLSVTNNKNIVIKFVTLDFSYNEFFLVE